MAWTQSDLDLLDDAIRAVVTSGTFSVQTAQFSDQATTFRSLKEMQEFRAWLAGQIVDSTTGTRTRYARTSKGV